MDFIIKTYDVPVFRDESGKVNYKEVKLDESNLTKSENIEIEFPADIPPVANRITNHNNIQLAMASADERIDTIEKQVLCSTIKPVNN